MIESLLAVAPERAALVCALTLPLIDQTAAAYRRDSRAVAEGRTRLLIVASRAATVGVPVTTEPETIARFLAEADDLAEDQEVSSIAQADHPLLTGANDSDHEHAPSPTDVFAAEPYERSPKKKQRVA